ncbi:MAG: TolC family protein [Candidatus Aminicenantaceae bacterium]
MTKTRSLLILLSTALVLSPLWGQQRQVKMTLEECIVAAVKNNLDIAVQVFNPQIAEMTIKQATEKFLPQLSFGFSKQSQQSPSYSFLETDKTLVSEYGDWSARLDQEIPTGGRLSINLISYKNDTNQSFQIINPRYGSTLFFRFEQPLLKNFGFKTSRREIIIAQNNLNVSDSQFKSSLLMTVFDVEEAYWNLVFAVENLKVMNQSLELAQDLLRKNRKEVEVGTLAPIEILTAEAEVATREADILQAGVAVENREDTLKTMLNSFTDAEIPLILIDPVERPDFERVEIDVDEALKVALLNRPDLQALRYDLENRDLDLSFARNQLLPDLSLAFNYWSPGISGTQLIYQDNDPYTGIVVGQVPGTGVDSLRDAFNFEYRNWAIGLTLTIPTQTFLTRAAESRARLALDQSLTQIKSQEKQIFLEVRNAVRLVNTNYKRVQAYQVARDLAERKLEVEEKKLRVGMTTNYIVLQHQRDLANARSTLLRAALDYVLTQAQLDLALGITLNKKNIKMAY